MKPKLLLLWLMLLVGAVGVQAQNLEAYYSVEYDEDARNTVQVTFY